MDLRTWRTARRAGGFGSALAAALVVAGCGGTAGGETGTDVEDI